MGLASGCSKCYGKAIVYLLFSCHRNHSSAFKAEEFVCQKVPQLLFSDAIVEVRREDLIVCKPLGVVRNATSKPQLIVDLQNINKHTSSCKFKYKDICTAADLFSTGDWFFKFDYKRGYHQIEILHQLVNSLDFLHSMVLPFSLSKGPYLFTKIQRALVKHFAFSFQSAM